MSEELRLQRSQIHDFVGDDPDAVRVIEKLLKGYNTLISGGTGRSIGSIFPHGGTTPPLGSFVCDGSAISRANYSELFAVIGTTWGAGDGSTTFNVPDLRGAFVRGAGSNG